MARLTWLELILVLGAGPLTEAERSIIKYARKGYSKIARGEDRETLADLKILVAKHLKILDHRCESKRIENPDQAQSASLLEIF